MKLTRSSLTLSAFRRLTSSYPQINPTSTNVSILHDADDDTPSLQFDPSKCIKGTINQWASGSPDTNSRALTTLDQRAPQDDPGCTQIAWLTFPPIDDGHYETPHTRLHGRPQRYYFSWKYSSGADVWLTSMQYTKVHDATRTMLATRLNVEDEEEGAEALRDFEADAVEGSFYVGFWGRQVSGEMAVFELKME